MKDCDRADAVPSWDEALPSTCLSKIIKVDCLSSCVTFPQLQREFGFGLGWFTGHLVDSLCMLQGAAPKCVLC